MEHNIRFNRDESTHKARQGVKAGGELSLLTGSRGRSSDSLADLRGEKGNAEAELCFETIEEDSRWTLQV